MEDREILNKEIYEPIKDLKNRFYQTKTQDEWDECKKQLIVLFDKAKPMMDGNFFEKYKDGVIATISKIYTFKEKYFKQTNGNRPVINKNSFIFREDEGEAFIKLCNALANYLEKK